MLASLAELTAFKPLDGETVLVRALQALRAADVWIRWKVGEDPEEASAIERADGDGYSSFLILKRWPIKSVSSLVVAVPGPFGNFTEKTWRILGDTDDDVGQEAVIGLRGAYLESRFEPWPEGIKNIKTTYTAGFTAQELSNLKMAEIMLTHVLLSESNTLGLGQVSLGDMQVQQVVRNPKDYQFIVDAIESCRRRFP